VSTPRTNFVCTIAGCEKPAAASQLCDKHYARLRRHGDPTVARRAHGLTTEERFWTKVDKRGPGECWPWLESTKPAGYGNCEGRPAHRVAYELLVGPIPRAITGRAARLSASALTGRAAIPRTLRPSHKTRTSGVATARTA
jgi:hypothetical protein